MPLRSLRGRRGAAVAVLLLVLALSVVLGIRARAGVQALGRASAAVNALEPRLDEFRTGSFGDLAKYFPITDSWCARAASTMSRWASTKRVM